MMDKRKEGLKFIYEQRQAFIEDLLDMTAIEAPSGQEQDRARALCEAFRDVGLSEVHVDRHGNAVGVRWGRDRDACVLIEAHMDTVFPVGTVRARPHVDADGLIRCPGVSDNTAGLINLIYVAKALQHVQAQTEKTLIFAGTVNEEGMGGEKGMLGLLQAYSGRIHSCITIDGCEYQDIVYKATAIKTKQYTIHGMGGHPYSEYGQIPQALRVAAACAEAISGITVPREPKTVVVVTSLQAGSADMMHAIPDTARFVVNFRSNSRAWMERLDREIEEIVRTAVAGEKTVYEQENRPVQLSYTTATLCDIPGGEQEASSEIVRALDAAIREVGGVPYYAQGGCCNSNIPISMCIPTVAVGTSNLERGEHSLQEFTPTDHIYKSTQEIFLLALKIGGMRS